MTTINTNRSLDAYGQWGVQGLSDPTAQQMMVANTALMNGRPYSVLPAGMSFAGPLRDGTMTTFFFDPSRRIDTKKLTVDQVGDGPQPNDDFSGITWRAELSRRNGDSDPRTLEITAPDGTTTRVDSSSPYYGVLTNSFEQLASQPPMTDGGNF